MVNFEEVVAKMKRPFAEIVFFPKRPLGLRVFSTRFGSDDVCGYGYVGACRVGSGR